MTHADVDAIDLQNAIKKLLGDRFSGVRIVSVSIANEGFREEGVIEIDVRFEGTTEDLVRGQPPGLYGMVREAVADSGGQRDLNPVFNFISSDAEA